MSDDIKYGDIDLPTDEFDNSMIAYSIYEKVKKEKDELQSQLAKAEEVLRDIMDGTVTRLDGKWGYECHDKCKAYFNKEKAP